MNKNSEESHMIRNIMQKYNIEGSVKKIDRGNEWTHIISVSCGNGADFEKFVNEETFQKATYFPEEGVFAIRMPQDIKK